ncbi:hypothetical protein ACFORH_10995 [Amycolatopsis roodepoortensis]|uniref:Uncharacterized protein n=1 Tax=Amycolatopsis roodepoortensis TaxID=700274 RepID=A0ABR9LAJ4_9PSEU|nr:hypothetical protein [Amycolatopsis roodepoortensis]MBE1577709.1 hypothetical protein [Amycolatopsis roodepoortensis]
MELAIFDHERSAARDGRHFLYGLRQVAVLVKALGGGAVRFSHLRLSSFEAAFRPVMDKRATDIAFQRILACLHSVRSTSAVPEDWSDEAIRAVHDFVTHITSTTSTGTNVTLSVDGEVIDRILVPPGLHEHLGKTVTS